MFATKYDDILGVTGNELEQINDKLSHFTPYSHRPPFDMIERKRIGTVAENIAIEINLLGCVTFVTRYGAVVGESV